MSKIKDGGPAFPVAYDHQVLQPDTVETAKRLISGMSLRDHFAGLVMQARMTAFCALETHHGWSNDEIAEDAYKLADAMLAQREKWGAA